jgi:GH25 family lysozyme M1 (1,4-beta-N-acetylmuramidase)
MHFSNMIESPLKTALLAASAALTIGASPALAAIAVISAAPKPEDSVAAKPPEGAPPAAPAGESPRQREAREAASRNFTERSRAAEALHTLIDSSCTPMHVAEPSRSLFSPSGAWNGTDSGPVVHSYVTLNGLPVLGHGVDISHYQSNVIDYDRLRDCGTEFAFVKLDRSFPEHASRLRARDIPVIPYHYLTVRGAWRGQRTNFTDMPALFGDTATEPELLDAARAIGRQQGQLFLTKYETEIAPAERVLSLPGLSGQLVALDVEEVFNGELHRNVTTAQRAGYGRFYAAALAEWVRTVQRAQPNSVVIFYTFPDVFASYLSYALPDDYAVVNFMPVWVAQTGDRSGLDLTSRQGGSGRSLQALCLSNGAGNRCIFHQYTHRGVFAAIQEPNADWTSMTPEHHDVDRYLGARAVVTEHGVTYVRPTRENPR